MLVGDLIYNDDFDANLNYEVWKGQHHEEGSELLVSTIRDGYHKPLASILDMEIRYLTTDEKTAALIIEAQ